MGKKIANAIFATGCIGVMSLGLAASFFGIELEASVFQGTVIAWLAIIALQGAS